MRSMRNIAAILVVLLSPILAVDVRAEQGAAAKIIDTTVAKVKQTVRENEGKMSPTALDDQLRVVIAPVFDFDTMAQSCLAQHWNEATPEQQKEFTTLFSGLLARTYLKKIRENAGDSAMTIIGDKTKGDRAIVKTAVKYDEDQTASIEYRMKQHGDTWRVYDVIIENIGLVSNYRSEFAGIVKSEKVEGLIKKLRDKKIPSETKPAV